MDSSTLSIIAIVFSTIALSFQIVMLVFRLNVSATILPSSTNTEGFSMFPVRLVIVNRASVGRTICGIKLDLPKKYRKAYSKKQSLNR